MAGYRMKDRMEDSLVLRPAPSFSAMTSTNVPASRAAAKASGNDSRYGKSSATSAITLATPTAASVERVAIAETINGISASVPASSRPQLSGKRLASRIPAMDDTCHEDQLVAAMPQKNASLPG